MTFKPPVSIGPPRPAGPIRGIRRSSVRDSRCWSNRQLNFRPRRGNEIFALPAFGLCACGVTHAASFPLTGLARPRTRALADIAAGRLPPRNRP